MKSQYLSRPDVQKYLSNFPDVTKEEKKELLKWLKMGYSPYSNDLNVFDENDRPADFIAAMRAFNAWCEEERIIHLNAENRTCDVLSSLEIARV